MSGAAVRPAEAARPSRRFPFRADVEGLRGLATALVLIYHADVPLAPGGYVGLDVFFVISGFLITGLLLREIEDTGRVSLARFYARRIRRLLPSVVVVLAFVVAAGLVILAPLHRDSLAVDVLAADLYVLNWRLAGQGIDYLSRGLEASPVQHFWSLSVEEQFYLVWPALLLAAALLWWRGRRGGAVRPLAAAAIVVLGGASLAYSIHYTAQAAGAAYFSTFTRGWEFAVGAAVALVPAARLRMPRWAAAGLVWAGLGALAWSASDYDGTTPYPGSAALVPTVAAAAIIAGGLAHPAGAPSRLIALRPVRWVGRISYSWYLWHWPVLVFAEVLWGPLSVPQKLGVVAASVVPAVAAHRLVEEPFRRSGRLARRPRRGYQLGAACTAAAAGVAAICWLSVPTIPVASPSQAVGAAAVGGFSGVQRSAAAIRPEPKSAIRDRGQADADGCLVSQRGTRSPPCVYGARSSRTTVVLFGDSHAMQYFPALEVVARRRGWRLVVLTKAGCTPADVAQYIQQFRREYRECAEWRGRALRRIARERPALVMVGNLPTHRVWRGGRLGADESARALEDGLAATLRRLRAMRARVVVARGNPRPPLDVRACVSRSLRRLARCAFSRREAYDYAPVNVRAVRRTAGARLIDPTPMLCPGGRCPAVIGNVLVYRNTAHITATYIRSLAPWLARRLPLRPRRG